MAGRSRSLRILMLACLAGGCLVAPQLSAEEPPAPPQFEFVRPDPGMDAKFARTEDWIGADGVYSLKMPNNQTYWLFGDTFAGTVRDGKRVNAVMINNSVARQTGWGEDAEIEFFVKRDEDGRPRAMIVPDGLEGYFWLWEGLMIDGKLHVFMTRVTSDGSISAFDWTLVGQSLAVIENPLDDPRDWKVQQSEIPFAEFTPDYESIYGTALIQDGETLYIYGSVRDGEALTDRHLTLAKVPVKQLADYSAWRFYRDGEWQTDARAATPLTSPVGTEGSVTYVPALKQYVLIYSYGLIPEIQARVANHPWGPWSEPTDLYSCPEVNWDPRVFCYAGKGRLVPGSDDELLVSYATNSHEMGTHLFDDARVYFPHFLNVKLKRPEGTESKD